MEYQEVQVGKRADVLDETVARLYEHLDGLEGDVGDFEGTSRRRNILSVVTKVEGVVL